MLSAPYGIALGPENTIWVADYGNHRIQQFDRQGNAIIAIGQRGSEQGEFLYPTAVALDSKGNIWITDSGNARLQQFTAKGELLKVVVEQHLHTPTAIALDRNDTMYVADGMAGNVLIFDSEGNYFSSIKGKATGIALDVSGNVWTVSKDESLIRELTPSGTELASFGMPSTSTDVHRHFMVIR
jgi:sugar lactone lactonase YvrE